MNKLIVAALCAAGAGINVTLTSRNRRNDALRAIDSHIEAAVSQWNPKGNINKRNWLEGQLAWFIWHHNQHIALPSHKKEFNDAVFNAIKLACK
uniref:Uncharacterized protein n=1 Tax=Pseudomonas phage RVTF4 TaxID=3236931 RepID=A0AB39CD61_9VIRU